MNQQQPNIDSDSLHTSYASTYDVNKESAVISLLKKGVWAYFLLLIFEGAIRKWVLPGLSDLFLIIRDPLVFAMLVYAWKKNILPNNIFIVWMTIIGVVAIFTALFLGHGNLFVSIFGARILLLHFPFIFLIGKLLNHDDVVKIGKVVVWISIPMAVLISLQFYSPQSAWVNRAVGGGFGSAFGGSMGYFRPPGTFSFTNGTTLFFSLVGAFVFYFWLKPNQINRLVLMAATGGLIMAIPFSISRGLTFTLVVMVLFVLVAVSRKPKYFGKILVAGFATILAFSLLSNTEFFETAFGVLTRRFESAAISEGGVEGTISHRYFGDMIEAITEATELPFFGLGIGMGTNVGSALMSGGRGFLIAEGEWGRLVGEMGALMGIAVIAMRLIIGFKLAVASYLRLKDGDILPWMILSFALLVFPQGQWAQPTTLGFSTLVVGLLLATLKEDKIEN